MQYEVAECLISSSNSSNADSSIRRVLQRNDIAMVTAADGNQSSTLNTVGSSSPQRLAEGNTAQKSDIVGALCRLCSVNDESVDCSIESRGGSVIAKLHTMHSCTLISAGNTLAYLKLWGAPAKQSYQLQFGECRCKFLYTRQLYQLVNTHCISLNFSQFLTNILQLQAMRVLWWSSTSA